VERGQHLEDRLPVLDRRHAPRGEAAAVAQPLHEVDDRRGEIAGQDEVAVERVRGSIGLHGPAGGDQRLGQHLPAEHAPGADVAIRAAKDVDLELLEVEDREELVEGEGHGVR
jgi:hypothetical protein